MKTEFDNYTRLAKGFLGMNSLWMGPDHLVYVKGEGFLQSFTEEYRRYRYRDIQAFSVAKTSRAGLTFLFLLGALFFAGIAALTLAIRGDGSMGLAMIIFLSILSGGMMLFLLLLVRHFILGPTCVCDIHTNLKRDRLHPLNRLHTTRQSLTELEAKIDEAQKGLVESTGSGEGDGTSQPAVATVEEGFKIPFPVLPTFSVFAIFSLFALGALHLESVWMVGIAVLLLLLGSMILTGTLVATIRAATPESIRTSLWVLLGLVFFFGGAASVYYVFAAVNDAAYTIGFTGPLEAFAGVATNGGTEFYLVFLVLLVGIVIASLIGILKVMKWRSRIAPATPEET